MFREWRRGEYSISTDPARLNLAMIQNYLSNSSYWASGRSVETVKLSINHSLSFGVYHTGQTELTEPNGHNERQVGFARVITDYATFAYLADVFVLDEFRGQGLGKWLVETVASHPNLQGLRRWLLATKDAHELYRKVGFVELKQPERWMEKSGGGR